VGLPDATLLNFQPGERRANQVTRNQVQMKENITSRCYFNETNVVGKDTDSTPVSQNPDPPYSVEIIRKFRPFRHN
jgi:hypothetical protein